MQRRLALALSLLAAPAFANVPLATCMLDKQVTLEGMTDFAVEIEVRTTSIRISGQDTAFPAIVERGAGQGILVTLSEEGVASNQINIGASGVVAWIIEGTDGSFTSYTGSCEFAG